MCGARARTSAWQNPDPALHRYLNATKTAPSVPTVLNNWHPHTMGPGLGGAFNPFNLNGFGYAHQSPLKLNDPNGESATVAGAVIGAAVGGGIAWWRGGSWREIAGSAVQGGIAGAAVGKPTYCETMVPSRMGKVVRSMHELQCETRVASSSAKFHMAFRTSHRIGSWCRSRNSGRKRSQQVTLEVGN